MNAWQIIEHRLTDTLALGRRPVAIAFAETVPAGVEPVGREMPSGCSFWRLAADGAVFYTVPRDHYNCPIGCYTHAIDLPPERAHELTDTLSLMKVSRYVKPEEIAGIHRLPRTPPVVVYAPLGDTPLAPDVIVIAGRPGRLMLAYEAALRADAAAALPLLGRPTCMAVPAALSSGAVLSVGCIGNRVHTELGDDDLYLALPGHRAADIVEALAVVVQANQKLMAYHRERERSTPSAAAVRSGSPGSS